MQILTAGHNIFGGGGFYFEWEFFPGYNGINPPHYTINTQYYPTTPGGRWVIKEYRRYNINGNTLEEHKYDIGGLEFFANSVIILDVPPVTEPVSVTYVTRRPGNPTPMWSLTYLMPQLAGYGPIHAENGEPGENYQQRQISYNMHCERQFLTCWERDEYVHFGMSGSPVLFQPNHYQRYGNAIGNRINGILVTSFPEHWTYYDWRYYKNLMLNGNAHFFQQYRGGIARITKYRYNFIVNRAGVNDIDHTTYKFTAAGLEYDNMDENVKDVKESSDEDMSNALSIYQIILKYVSRKQLMILICFIIFVAFICGGLAGFVVAGFYNAFCSNGKYI
eukprot:249804_1